MKTNLGVILRVKTCEVFLCFLAIIFLGSIVLTSYWLLCINCFTSLVSFTGFYTEDEPTLGVAQTREGGTGVSLARVPVLSCTH